MDYLHVTAWRVTEFAARLQGSARTARGLTDDAEDDEQHQCADECDKDGAADAVERHGPSHFVENPTADERSNDTNHHVGNQAVAANHERSEDPRYQADDEPGEDIIARHVRSLPSPDKSTVPTDHAPWYSSTDRMASALQRLAVSVQFSTSRSVETRVPRGTN